MVTIATILLTLMCWDGNHWISVDCGESITGTIINYTCTEPIGFYGDYCFIDSTIH